MGWRRKKRGKEWFRERDKGSGIPDPGEGKKEKTKANKF
jgi:hypothetical protein